MAETSNGSFMRRHPLAAYLAITYVITWALLLPLALAARGLIPLRLPPAWHALGALGPFVAAFLVTSALGGRPAVRAWLSGFCRWRMAPGWWVLAVGSPIILFAVSAVAVRLVGGEWPEFQRLLLPEYTNPAWLLDVLFVGTFAYAIGEEPGWRGFALPRLEAKHGPLVGTLLLVPVWALFHWPAFFYRPTYQGGLPTIAGFLFGLLAGAIVLTFLYDGSGRSLLSVVLFHALINIAIQVAAIVSTPVVAVMNVLIAVGAVAIVTWWLSGGRHVVPVVELPGEAEAAALPPR